MYLVLASGTFHKKKKKKKTLIWWENIYMMVTTLYVKLGCESG